MILVKMKLTSVHFSFMYTRESEITRVTALSTKRAMKQQ